MPMVDRVEIAVIEEPQPRWLAFLSDEQDVVERIPDQFCEQALPNNKLAPNLAKRGIQMVRYQRNDVSVSYFAMEHPVVGGYTPDKVALRRAIALAVDVEREIRLARYGQAIPAQSHVAPQVWGYDPAFKSEMSEFDRAKARALLDLYGYVDRDGDGWREQPDGTAAGDRVRDAARPGVPRAVRAVGQQHEGDRHPHRAADPPVAREPEGLARRQADDVGRRLVGRRPTARPSWSSATAPTRARPTMRASTCRRSTRCTSASACCPTGPNALR